MFEMKNQLMENHHPAHRRGRADSGPRAAGHRGGERRGGGGSLGISGVREGG